MQDRVDYTAAITTKYPEQIVIGIARDAEGKHNPITLGWTTIVSHEPPMMVVAIGRSRYSLQTFRHTREFVIAFPSEQQQEEAMLFGTRSGRDTDKLATAGAEVVPATLVDSVLLADAVANFECRLVSELETGDHVVFAGEVVCAHTNPRRPNRLYTIGEGYAMGGLPRRGG